MAAILEGRWSSAQMAGFVVALRVRGETPRQIAAAAQALRASMVTVKHRRARVLDTCGTGGDGRNTLNLSTAAAIVVAACGVPVAKHGNRAVSSRSGSADLLEALGVKIELSPERHAALLEQVGITFLFAPQHHQALNTLLRRA
jgi:anthranilate phosphoribosyltransferase